MGLGQDVRGADVEQESREEAEIGDRKRGRRMEQERRRRSEDRRYGVQQQHRQRAPLRVAMDQHQADGVEAVAKVVGDDRKRHADARRIRNLEREPDADTVHEAVSGEGKGGEHADLRMMMRGVVRLVRLVQQQEFLQAVKQQKSEDQSNHRHRGIDRVPPREVERLGDDVERHHAEQHAGRERQNEAQVAGKA